MKFKKMNTKIFSILVFLMFIFCMSNVCYAQYETFDRLQTAARDFISKTVQLDSGESFDVQVHEPDHLQLAMCSNPIEVTLPEDANKEQITSVKLSCHGDTSWHIFLPVNVTVYSQVLVAKHPIAARDIITEDDITFAKYDKSRLFMGSFNDKNIVIGMEALHVIPSGGLLTKQSVQPPVLVHRGQGVDLIAGNSAVIVTMKGIAKTDGRLNETIKAFNPTSKRILDALVIGPDKAQVVM
jgi:flagellar basal body P-ring formation protein FlgA